jgi:hypothetical protein
MSDYLSAITAYFAEQQHWPSSPSTSPECVEVRHEWQTPSFKSYAYLVNRGPAFVYDSICPDRAAPEQRDAVARFITRVNCELSVCAFSMNWDDGTVRCRSAVTLQGTLTENMIAGVVYPHHQVMIDWLTHLMGVIRGEQDPDEAFSEAIEQLG